MSITLYAGWQQEVVGDASINITNGADIFASTITTGKQCHEDIQSVVTGYDDFATTLQTALNADSAAAGYTVAFNSTTNVYTISHASSFSVAFVGDSGTRMRHALGFSQTGYAANTSRSSDMTPHYVIVPAAGCRSNDTKPYEPEDVVLGTHTLGGSHYGIASSSPIRFWDFDLMFEREAATFIDDAPDGTTAADVPWTYEHLWKHCRSAEPFLLLDVTVGVKDSVHFLRQKNASWNQTSHRPESPDYHDFWHMRFETFLKGYLP